MTTPSSARRAALAIVGSLVLLVGLSMAWDGLRSDDDAADAEEADEAEPATTTTTNRRRTTTTLAVAQPGAAEVPPSLTRPVPGFEDEWLIVVSTSASGTWTVPLGGGEPVRLGFLPGGEVRYLIDGSLVGHSGGTSLRDGSSWRFDVSEAIGEEAARTSPGWLIGASDADTIIWGSEGALVEVSGDGSIHGTYKLSTTARWWLPYPRAVVRRQVLFEGPHGLIATDLDSGTTRRLTVGAFIAAAGDGIIVEECDDRVRCRLVLIDVTSGEHLVDLDVASRSGSHSRASVAFEPVASPDGQRLALLEPGNQVALFDLVTGERVGQVTIPATALDHSQGDMWQVVHVLWSTDSEAMLVFITGPGGPASTRPVHFVAQLDRDGTYSEVREDLAEVIRLLSRSTSSASLFVSAEEYHPWTDR